MSLSELKCVLDSLSSGKITERKKSCEALFEILKQKQLIALLDSGDNDVDWNWVFQTVLHCLNQEIGRVEETGNQGNKVTYTMKDQITRCNDLFVTVVRVANRRVGQIDFSVIFKAFKRCLTRPLHQSYLVNRYLLIFKDYVLPKPHYWGTINAQEWIELFEILKSLHEENVESKALMCIHQIVKYGPRHSLSVSFLKSQHKIVQGVCQSVEKTSPVWLRETVLELFLDFCQQIVKNGRRFCCRLGEEVLNNLVLLYEPYSSQAKIKITLLEVLLFQVRIHHPSRDSNDIGSSWTRCLRRLCCTISDIIEKRDKDLLQMSETGRNFHPVFTELAVDIYKQQQSFGAVDQRTEGSSKRKCVEFGLSTIVDNIQFTREWAWINLLANILKKYPNLIDVTCYKRLLTFLAGYLPDCKISDTRSHIFDCLAALVQSESALAQQLTHCDDLDNLWSLIWDAALRLIGLNENQLQTHNLIQRLIASNKKWQNQLASTFTSCAISVSSISLTTLNVLGSQDGLSFSSVESRKCLIKWILSSEKNAVFASRIAGEVLVNLTLKQWPGIKQELEVEIADMEELFKLCEVNGDLFEDKAVIKETAKQMSVIAEVFATLMELLNELSSNLREMDSRKILNVLPRFILLVNLLNRFMDFEVADGEANLVLLIDRHIEMLWESLTLFLNNFKPLHKNTAPIIDLILSLFEADVRHFIKDKIPVDVLKLAFRLLADDCEDEDPAVKTKLRIIEVIAVYCVHARNDTQKNVLNALINFSFDASNPVDYSQAMIILKYLGTSKDDLAFILKSVYIMIKKICDVRYKEFDVAIDILDVLYSLIPFAATDSEAKENLTSFLMTFYQLRDNYGPKVAVKVANCIGKMIEMEADLSSWCDNEDEVASVLPTLLVSDQSEVRFAAARNLIGLFSRKDDKLDTPIYQKQKTIFQEICQAFSKLFEDIGEDEDETVNRTASVLYTLAVVITSTSLLRQRALFELFYVTHVHNLELGKVDKILQNIASRLNLNDSRLLLENQLGYLLHQWNASRFSLKDFPVLLFRCQNDTLFYDQYISHILPILFNEEDTSVFETICQQIGKTAEEIIEDAYPKIVAKSLVTASLRTSEDFEVSPEDVSLSENVQGRIRSYLREDNCQEIVLRKLDDVVVQLLQFVFDFEHFRETFEVDYSLPEPDTTFLTVRLFENATELLRKKLATSEQTLMDHLTAKNLKQTQLILLKLTKNLHKSTTFEDMILNFHRYSLYLNLLKQHLSPKFSLSRFIVHDVTHNLMNLTRSSHPLIPLLATKLFLKLTETFIPHTFDNFLIEVSSALVPIAQTSTPVSIEAMKILKTLIEDTRLREELRIMDPLPETDKFEELRRSHFEVKGREDLRGVIQGFLRGGVRCRIEGLRYLRRELMRRRSELKTIYEELHKYRGASNEDSVLHLLVGDLVRLTSSQNKTESVEAAKCLGELGSSDLTTMVLKTEASLSQLDGKSTVVGTSQIVKLLIDYLVDEDIEIVCASSDALHAIFTSADGQNALTKNLIFDVDYLVPFRFSGKPLPSKFSLDKAAFISMLQDEELWCPEAETDHRKWITNLVSGVLSCVNEPVWYKVLLPLCRIKISFAESLLPVLVNILMGVNETAFRMFSGSVGKFFEKHWRFRNTGKCSVVLSRPSVKVMLDVVHFVRVQRNVTTKSDRKRLELDLDYLQVALAAQFCGAHFSTLMYAELWCQKLASDIRNSRPQTGSSVLEMIRENRRENKYLQEILRQAYINIGDGDALHNVQLIDPLDLSTQVNAFSDLNRLDLVVLHYDIHGASDSSSAHRDALKNFSLLDLSSKFSSEPQYEILWRLGRWDLPTTKTPKTFEAKNYYALKALKESDETSLFEDIQEARKVVTNSLRFASLESCKNLYEAATSLQCLQELEEVQAGGNLSEVFIGWKEKDSINRNEFQYVERVLSHRKALLSILIGRFNSHNNVQPIGDKDSVTKALVDTQLELSRLARLDGKLNVAMRAVGDLLKLELEEGVKCEIVVENSQIYWEIDKRSGMHLLRRLLSQGIKEPRLLSKALSLYGTWLVETKTESTKTIINEYFLKSIELLENLQCPQIFEATDKLARFADEEYQEILYHTNSAIFLAKVKNVEKLKENAEKLKGNAQTNNQDEIRRASIVYQRLSEIDEKEIENTIKEKESYLKLALKYYLYNLQHSDVANITIFRLISLFLHNKLDPILTSQTSNLLHLPSYKLIPVLPQLVPHLTNNPDDLFGQKINQLLENVVLEHPHHALPLILAVANSNKDDLNCSVVEPRVEGAKTLVKMLKGRFKDKFVQNSEFVADALIQLAYYECGKESKPVGIPRAFKIRAVRRMENVLVPTYNLPVRKNADYKNIIGIYKFLDDFNLVGGINAPKLIKCVGTDGQTRNLLVKGKDDLRQDAVMQQVFTIMNGLLGSSKTTSNLLIRTYKVLPLSRRSGVLEWVDNSMPFGEYLVGKKGAHVVFNAGDISPEECRQRFRNLQNEPYDRKLSKYLAICERFRPAFHKFFETTFLQPTEWYERRRFYTQSVATTSMCGYVLGLGDRHVNNILVDKNSAEVIHIDFGIAFEQGKVLPTPETVPFRLTRDIEDGMGVSGVEGTFRRSCEKTMRVLRENTNTILTILEVLLYDPLYAWTITPNQAYSRQLDLEVNAWHRMTFSNDDNTQVNLTAERALNRLRQKLQGTEFGGFSSVEGQVSSLIQQARDPANLCKLFHGWQPYL